MEVPCVPCEMPTKIRKRGRHVTRPVGRILLVVESIRDGVYNQVRNLIRQLHDQRPEARLDVCYSSAHAEPAWPEMCERIAARGGETLDLEVGREPCLGDLRALRRLHRFAARTRPDVIHAHSSKAGGLTRLAAVTSPGFPSVLYTPHAYYGLGGNGIKSRAFNVAERLLGQVGLSTNCSLDERDFALRTLRLKPRRLILLHHGIALERFRPAERGERMELRRQLGLPTDRPLLVSVGRVSYQKNYEPLYGALDQLANGAGGMRFAFAHAGAGSGALAAGLSARARAKVTTFEHLPDSAPLLRAADAFILTSRFEGLSIAVLETLACGIKVMLTKVPGSACLERMRFSDIQWIEPGGNPTDLQARLLGVLDKWSKSDGGSINATQAARMDELFNEHRQFKKLFRLYDLIASGSVSEWSGLPNRVAG